MFLAIFDDTNLNRIETGTSIFLIIYSAGFCFSQRNSFVWGEGLTEFVYHHSDDEHIQMEFEKLFIHVKKEDFED